MPIGSGGSSSESVSPSVSLIWMRRSTSRTLSRYSATRSRSDAPSCRRRSDTSPVTQSRMLRSRRRSTSRSAAVPPSPNRRSNTTRGLFSIGSGVVGVRQEIVYRYWQL